LAPLLPRLNREWRPETLIRRAGTGGPIIAGLAFAIAWAPWGGPTLAGRLLTAGTRGVGRPRGPILAAAATSGDVASGGVLLAFYSLGLAVPFLLCAIAFDKATMAFRWLRDRWAIVSVVSGLILIAMGLLILTGELTQLNIEAQRALQKV